VGLVEVLLVLAISAVVLAFGMLQFQSARDQSNADTQVGHVTQVIGNLQALYGATGYAALSTDPGPDYNCSVIPVIVPAELLGSSNNCTSTNTNINPSPTYPSAYNISDGRIQIQPASNFDSSLSGTDFVALVWDHVPSIQCVPLVVGTQSLARAIYTSGEPIPATVGTTPPQPVPQPVKPLNGQLDTGLAAQWCVSEQLPPPSGSNTLPAAIPVGWVQIIYILSRS
jgi:type II secretory pathway pseudopilin PulG